MKNIHDILSILRKTYPDADCSLTYKDPFQLLTATILSAQCTDERVNKVTPELFRKFPDAKSMSEASLTEIENIIRSTGFFRAKAKSLSGMSKSIQRDWAGRVPDTMEALVHLPGVGRKTANVVLGNAFQRPAGVVVDTHVKRLAYRLGLTKHSQPEKVEIDLSKLFDPQVWTELPHLLIQHGRQICMARNPQCLACPLLKLCPRKGLPNLKESSKKQGNVNVKKIRNERRKSNGRL